MSYDRKKHIELAVDYSKNRISTLNRVRNYSIASGLNGLISLPLLSSFEISAVSDYDLLDNNIANYSILAGAGALGGASLGAVSGFTHNGLDMVRARYFLKEPENDFWYDQ